MLARNWHIRIEDMLGAIAKIERYAKGLSHTQFHEDERTIDAVVRNLIVIGEAARLVPDEIAERHPEIAWTKMRGLRNLAVHEYFGVDADILWETIQHDLLPLASMLRRVLEEQAE
jgi:uncharacterized protein with HEPN domain